VQAVQTKNSKPKLVRTLIILIAVLFSLNIHGQEVQKPMGSFGYSMSWYLTVELNLLDSGNFTLRSSSDIGASRTIGKWSKQESTLILAPTKCSYYSSMREKWIDNDNPADGFFYSKIKILSVDRLYVENDEGHVHLNRLPTDKDGPHKIHFPNKKIYVPDSKDSVLVKEILLYIKKWPYEYGYTIQLSAQTSEKDYKTDKYIGLKRCRSIVRYFQEQIGIGWNDFIIKDLDHGDQEGSSFVELKIIYDYP
jgi:hypothetical protein